ncbi:MULTISPECIES: DHA2 family efflux MFS transporter permease subunit [Dietzia]|uniref:DHA2 family efflux MFS transporter permease subunit n=2 Tax=Dietzia TaxID=37914 RepID=A0ABN2J637_9ACTN|nr:multidrug efflux MFS transporter [Dietzia sp. Cai40]MBB1047042.1 multidrug efflux MFS transporter [Dietzia cercidiphylli]MBB1058308.1 multidrug efflux MFS transporter [Dietzia sp. B19]MBC7274161.1 multidrug efflux MFS transporter [Streptomyces sp.]
MTTESSAAAFSPAQPDPALGSAPLPAATKRLIALLVAAAFVVILNETIMSVAIPELMGEFAVTAATAQWLTTAFMLTMAVVIPFTGWMLMRLPLRTVFIIAMTTFTLGTLLASLAPVFVILVAGRVVQAVGTAIMIPLLMTTVLNVVPADRRGRTMGVISIVIAVAPAIGPTVGGLVLDVLSWRWMFWFVLPIGVLALVAGATLIRNVTATRAIPLDILSGVLSAVGFAGLIFGLSSFGEAANDNALVSPWVPVLVGVAALSVFVWRQLALKDYALLDVRAFTFRTFTVSLSLMLLSMMALFGTLILLPLYMQQVLGTTTLESGLALLPGGLLMGVLGWFVGRLFDRIGPRPLIIPGSILAAAGLWGMYVSFSAESSLAIVVVWHMILSVGLALLFSPLLTSALGSLPPHLYSHGSALLNTLQQVAAAAGTALFITVMTLGIVAGAESGEGDVAAQMTGVHNALLVGAIISLITVVGAWFVRNTAQTEGPAVAPMAEEPVAS